MALAQRKLSLAFQIGVPIVSNSARCSYLQKSSIALRRRKLTSTAAQTSASTPFAPISIPSAANEIEDGAAQRMLRRIRFTPLDTELEQQTIYTSHVISNSDNPEDSFVIFLHGFDSNLLEYRFMLPLLDDAPVEAHFVDILGWGLTERPTTPAFSYGPKAKREHLRAYIRRFGADRRVILAGASVGGATAIDYFLNDDLHQVAALVLIDAQAFTDKKRTFVDNLPGVASLGAEVLRSKWLRKIAADMSYEDDRFKCDDVLRIGGLHCKEEGWKEATVDFIKGEGYCLSTRISEVDCPCLVLWGENDRVLPRGDAGKFADLLSFNRVEFISNAGHSPHIEQASTVTENILEFISDL